MKKKILFILTRPPLPATDGTRERILGELKALSGDFAIDILIISDENVKTNTIKALEKIGIVKTTIFKLKTSSRYLRVFSKLLSKQPLQSAYFYHPKAYNWLEQHAANYTAIHFHTIRFGFYIESLKNKNICPDTRLLLCFNDAISMNYREASQKAKGLWQIIYKIETERIKNYEIKLLGIADSFSIISSRDRNYILNNWKKNNPIGSKPNITIIRNAIEESLFEYNYQPQTDNLVFIGNLMYPPNRQGLKLFCQKIWPEILKRKPEIKLIIIGRGGQQMFSRYPQVEAMGFMENPYPLMTQQALFISPADFGAGVPTKSLLAMALGLPVISTNNNSAGIEGIADEINICLIDYRQKSAAANKIIKLLENPKERIKIGRAGKNLVYTNYRQSINYPLLKKFISSE